MQLSWDNYLKNSFNFLYKISSNVPANNKKEFSYPL
jgi:hypothetical protein